MKFPAVGLILPFSLLLLSPAFGDGEPRLFDELQFTYAQENYLEATSRTREESRARWARFKAALREESPSETAPKFQTLQTLSRTIVEHPIAGRGQRRNYDPDGTTGFCFGRALVAHLEALRMGVPATHVRKLWAVGPLGLFGHHFSFHVSTIVRDRDGAWWAIDPSLSRSPIRASLWAQTVRAFYSRFQPNSIDFFISAPERYGPESPAKYSRRELQDPGYRGYFRDLFEHNRLGPRPKLTP